MRVFFCMSIGKGCYPINSQDPLQTITSVCLDPRPLFSQAGQASTRATMWYAYCEFRPDSPEAVFAQLLRYPPQGDSEEPIALRCGWPLHAFLGTRNGLDVLNVRCPNRFPLRRLGCGGAIHQQYK